MPVLSREPSRRERRRLQSRLRSLWEGRNHQDQPTELALLQRDASTATTVAVAEAEDVIGHGRLLQRLVHRPRQIDHPSLSNLPSLFRHRWHGSRPRTLTNLDEPASSSPPRALDRSNDNDYDEDVALLHLFEATMQGRQSQGSQMMRFTADSVKEAVASVTRILALVSEECSKYGQLVERMELDHGQQQQDYLDAVQGQAADFSEKLAGLFGAELDRLLGGLAGQGRWAGEVEKEMERATRSPFWDGCRGQDDFVTLLSSVRDRELFLRRGLVRIEVAVFEAKAEAHRPYVAAAEFLRGGRLRGCRGVDRLFQWFAELGDAVVEHRWISRDDESSFEYGF